MALNGNKIPGKKFDRPDPLEPGSYPARIVQIIGLGLQEQRPFKGEEKDPAYELYVTYECLDEFLKDKDTGEELEDKPRWISETFPLYSLSSDKANSTKRYYAIDPEEAHGGDWGKLAESPVVITVVHNKVTSGKYAGRVFENIAGVSSMRPKDAAKAAPLKNPAKVFDADEPDMGVFLSLPEWLQTKIKENLNYEGSKLEALLKKSKKDEPVDEEEQDDQVDAVDDEEEDSEDW